MIALSLGLGLKEWVFRPRLQLILRHPTRPDEISNRVVHQTDHHRRSFSMNLGPPGGGGGPADLKVRDMSVQGQTVHADRVRLDGPSGDR